MDRFASMFTTILDLALVIAGFSLIILIHELGHFLAARWAGIRVMAFALGFGPAMVSYRKGLGLRRGSSEGEYQALVAKANEGGASPVALASGAATGGVSSTEYRWNILPLGGYVKMLGQDDADPSARSDAPDSYQNCVPWKRMIVISAGVICNVFLSAFLFVIVFTVGLATEPCKIGFVLPGSAAAGAVAQNAKAAGVTQPGLRPGDEVVSIGGSKPDSFKDLTLAAAMASRGSAIELLVRRPGVKEALSFAIVPREDPLSGMLALGVMPASTNKLASVKDFGGDELKVKSFFQSRGLKEATPGMELVELDGRSKGVDGQPLSAADLSMAAAVSDGSPMRATFALGDKRVTETITPTMEFPIRFFASPSDQTTVVPAEHLAGLTAVLSVGDVRESAEKAGLKAGDIFARLGDLQWPGFAEGITEIKRDGRKSISVAVARGKEGGGFELVDLGDVPVVDGVIGFGPKSTASVSTLVSRWPHLPVAKSRGRSEGDELSSATLAFGDIRLPAGARVATVDGRPVANFADIWRALRNASEAGASVVQGEPVSVTLGIEVPAAAGDGLRRNLAWIAASPVTVKLGAADLKSIASAAWVSPVNDGLFDPEKILLKGEGPTGAIAMGMRETGRAMTSTYLTFLRLFQGTVKVENLKGPVGIAHLGTIVASRGFIWVLFFMAVVSVNLAVINFLPLPIVDGGQFLFLLYEQVTGKPVSVAVQNVAVIAGLLLIGSVFLITTFNDLANLLWRK